MVLGLGTILASPDAPKDSTSMQLQHGDGVRVAYTSSGPIAISSDADFVSQGWPGSGTAADPYRIENLSIVTSSNTAINVSSTTAYFVIKNCLIQNSSSVDLTTGIALKDNAHGAIRDCIVENKHDGIYINGSNETALDNNTFLGVMVSAMYVQWASGLSITNSTVSLDANRGVTLEYVDDVEISHNLFNNTDYGIYSYYGDDLSISSNTILPSSSSGVYVYWTSNVTAYDNYVTAINSAGLIFYSSDSLNVTRNTVSKAHASGIIAQYSDHVEMSFNTIEASTYGITLSRITNGSIRGSVISGCTLYGL
ncbi:MAG: right-handed parallel beta-helix repeat-containing protein, partial [Candidatus Thorarchaeota archaeon]